MNTTRSCGNRLNTPEVMIAPIPTASELYDRHAPLLYGTVLRLADGVCAEEAFQDACIELWDTAAKRSQPCSITRMVEVSVAKARERCTKGGTTPEFERRLSELVAELRDRE